ncbi:MAG TPA: CoA transferase [Dehalococcoidia bacterium]|nr:CoA transferase [Dehalococcoidia bacterium]
MTEEASLLKPLAGIRVCDFFWLIAGPATSRIMADFGAEVIKIESEEREDQIRNAGVWPPNRTQSSPNAVFVDCNTNKLSLTLNLNQPKAIEIARQLVAISDVVTNNFTGERMDRWGLGYRDLVQVKPDIVMLSMPVMGTTGPYRSYGANGLGVVSYGGINTTMGFPGRPPSGMGPLYSDFTTPYFALMAIMAALRHRDRTGEGQFIDLSQAQATVALLGTSILEYTANGRVPERPGNRSRDYCPHGAYPCWGEDRWCAIAVGSDAEWRALCDAIGRPELATDPRFATHEARKASEDEVDAILAGWTRGRDAWQVMHYLQDRGVMASVVEDLEDVVVRDPHMRALHFETLSDADGVAQYIAHRQPAKFQGRSPELRRPPVQGEHNEYVLKELLGYSDEEYVQLLIDGVLR